MIYANPYSPERGCLLGTSVVIACAKAFDGGFVYAGCIKRLRDGALFRGEAFGPTTEWTLLGSDPNREFPGCGGLDLRQAGLSLSFRHEACLACPEPAEEGASGKSVRGEL